MRRITALRRWNRARRAAPAALASAMTLALALPALALAIAGAQGGLRTVTDRSNTPLRSDTTTTTPTTRDFFRVHGDRVRGAFDGRGADLLILGLGLAAAVALAALIAS